METEYDAGMNVKGRTETAGCMSPCVTVIVAMETAQSSGHGKHRQI